MSEPSFLRVAIPFEGASPLGWLAGQDHAAKLYWASRDGDFEVAGVGVALRVDSLENAMLHLRDGDTERYFYGSMRFDDRRAPDDIWGPFGKACFMLPAIELRRVGNKCQLIGNGTYFDESQRDACIQSIHENLDGVVRANTSPTLALATVGPGTSFPDWPRWEQAIASCLTALEQRHLEKVVLARKKTYTFAHPKDASHLMQRLRESAPGAYHFCFQLGGELAFLGASPEQLFMRDGLHIDTESLAGTRRRDVDEERDTELANELQHSAKECWEHDLVRQQIESALHTLCIDHGVKDQRQIIKLPNVQHLRTRFSGVLREGISDEDIIDAMHPTSAVCGFPREKSFEPIAHYEQFDRGHYAGPVGYVGAKKSEFAVGIRSGLICGNQLHLFAGAGIVKGSQAKAEWDEIDHKMRIWTRLLE